MSAPVLRASIGRGLNASDENARLFAEYFESLGYGGHWPLGDFLSLVYFGGMLLWGLVALEFSLVTGVDDFFFFGVVDTLLLLALIAVYRLLLNRLLRQARRAGYQIQILRRFLA